MEVGRKRTHWPRIFPEQMASCHRLYLAILLACFFQYIQAQVTKSPLDEKGIQITHQIGVDAVMTCIVKDLGARRIIWKKLSDPFPISVGNTQFNPSKKYMVDAIDNKSVLTVKNIKIEDAGEYQCSVSGQVTLTETLTLNIKTATSDNTYLLQSETEISAEVGATVVLPCLVENIQNNVVLWKNGQNDVLSLRRKIYNGDRRLSIKHDTRPQWSLQIKNLRKSDFGFYTCIINAQPVLTRTIRLKNAVPAQYAPLLIQDSSFQKRLDVTRGETVTLTCNFKASPAANVTWYRRKIVGGKTVKEDLGQGNTFTLRSVSPEQGGQYICVGSNGLSPDGRGKTELVIIGPPTPAPSRENTTFVANSPIAPVLYSDQHRTGQRRGFNVEIKCTAIGLPRPSIHWTRNGHKLTSDHKYNITDRIFRHDTYHSVLLVRSLSDRDFGQYNCVGYNTLGLHTLPLEIYLSS